VVLFVLEAHGALHFRSVLNECAQGISRQRVVVTARDHILELLVLVVLALGVRALKEEALDFVGGVERVLFLL